MRTGDDPTLGSASLRNLPTVRADVFAGDRVAGAADEPQPTARGRAEVAFENDGERRYCKSIVDDPMLPSSQYPKLAGVSPKTAQRFRQRLVQAGLIREHMVESGRRGRHSILLEATAKGLAAVKADTNGRD